MTKVRIIITGGTIDKHYDPVSGELHFSSTSIPELAEEGRCNSDDIVFQELLEVDSLSMTEAQRREIVAACKEAEEEKILITHGTDTMEKTARELSFLAHTKSIVLTGAMIPASLNHSDALFNLGYALGCLHHIERGIHICINGESFPWNRVHKDRIKARFLTP